MPESTILDRIAAGLRGAGHDFVRHSQEGINNFDEALSGVRVKPGAIMTDAGYVMPDAQGNADFSQVGMERVPDVLRAATLFGGAMPWGKGVGMAAKTGTGGKAAAMAIDEASRLARADEMGFTIPAYHGTKGDFKKFSKNKIGSTYGADDVGFFATNDPSEAAGAAADATGKAGQNVMPLRIRMSDPHVVDVPEYAKDFLGNPKSPTTYFDSNKDDILSSALEYLGSDGVIVRQPATGKETYIFFEPNQARSVFAKFDPSKRESENLLAAQANLGPLAAALAGDSQK